MAPGPLWRRPASIANWLIDTDQVMLQEREICCRSTVSLTFILKVPDKYFSILLKYLKGLQGGARDVTMQKAEVLMKAHDDDSETEDSSILEKRERIRKVLQLLSWKRGTNQAFEWDPWCNSLQIRLFFPQHLLPSCCNP